MGSPVKAFVIFGTSRQYSREVYAQFSIKKLPIISAHCIDVTYRVRSLFVLTDIDFDINIRLTTNQISAILVVPS